MAFDVFPIHSMTSGQQTDAKPWKIMDDSFETLQNAYPFRGRIVKRFGSSRMGSSQLESRLRINLHGYAGGHGITDINGDATGNILTYLAAVNANDTTFPFSIGQAFSIGAQVYTISNPAAGANAMLVANINGSAIGAAAGTFNLATGAYVITGATALTDVFFYPGFPVMGIDQYNSGSINNHPTYAFDTRYTYIYGVGIGWNRSGIAFWRGNNSNYFFSANWQGGTIAATSVPVLFTSNFQVTNKSGVGVATDDPIWYYDGTNWIPMAGAGGINGIYFLPAGGATHSGPFVESALMIIPFKNRLLLLNTIENNGGAVFGINTQYKNRCRYSYNGSPFAVNSWYEPGQQDVAGNTAAGAGALDATTEEAIVSAQFVKDRLIVYFERSTWEIAYTGNENRPFIWQKINTELGSQSTYSTVPFDKVVFTIGNTGVHACNGSNVQRIDDKIPNKIFDDFASGSGFAARTCGIRDYYHEMVYWAYCENNTSTTQVFPNQTLVYNYKTDTWAVNDDCITTFGYLEQNTDLIWGAANLAWQNANYSWSSLGSNAEGTRSILFGTPEGYVLIINDDTSRNAPSMQITNMVPNANGILTLTIMGHNLDITPTLAGNIDYIMIEGVTRDATMAAYFIGGLIYPVNSIIDANTITVDTNLNVNGFVPGPLVAGVYAGGATAAKVSNLYIKSKEWNPYAESNRNVYIASIDFAVDRTSNGKVTVDYWASTAPVSMIQAGLDSTSLIGSGVLETSPYDPIYYPLEQYQTLLWHKMYFQSSGEFIQLVMYYSPEQMVNQDESQADFQLEGMTLICSPTDSRMQ